MRSVISRLSPSGVALFLFHGVTRATNYSVRNYTGKHVLADEFATLLKALSKVGVPLSMDEIIDLQRSGGPYPPNSFSITFDDGFENNYTVAAPILKDFGIPAVFYVTTDWISKNQMSWVDRIEFCLEHTPSGAVHLPWEKHTREFRVVAEKMEIASEIRRHVKVTPGIDIEFFVAGFFDQCGCEFIISSGDPLDQKMTWAQVAELNEDPMFTVGGHTETHAMLGHVPRDVCEREIDGSLNSLWCNAHIGPRHYSYPEGTETSFNDNVIALLKSRGVVCCPTAIDGINDSSESLFYLKRILVG